MRNEVETIAWTEAEWRILQALSSGQLSAEGIESYRDALARRIREREKQAVQDYIEKKETTKQEELVRAMNNSDIWEHIRTLEEKVGTLERRLQNTLEVNNLWDGS